MLKRRYRLLKCLVVTIGVVFFLLFRLQQRCINSWKAAADKNRALFLLMNQWVYRKQEGKNLQIYFDKNNYKRIAIYGMGDVGLRLVKELEHSGIDIVYGIDRNAPNIQSDIRMVKPNDELDAVDTIIVALIGGFDEVFDVLSQKIDCPIIAIEDILNEI